MKPIDFNAMAVALKAAIESRDEFTKKNFIEAVKKFIQGNEAIRFFNALDKEHYIRNTKGYKYAFVIEPGVVNRNELVKLFDQYKVRKPTGGAAWSKEQRKAHGIKMAQARMNKKCSLADFTIEELQAELARREYEAQVAVKKKLLQDILDAAELTIDELKQIIVEVEQYNSNIDEGEV